MNESSSLLDRDPEAALQSDIQPAVLHASPVRIDIDGLSLSFGKTDVLKGINLSIEPGEFFAFLGPSGSGKSTLLRAIAGFGPKHQGRILIGGEDISGKMPWQRDVGMVFQSYALWPHLSVAKNVAYGLEERRVARADIKRRVAAALELVDMASYADRYPSQLSGGQQQRVALARTVAVEPRVLLLDEPLSNLDAGLRVQMRRELLQLQRRLGITTIFVTHDQEEANSICDRIAVMTDGVIQQTGAPASVYDNPVNEFVARFLGTANIIAGKVAQAEGGRVFVADAGGLTVSLDDNAGAGKGHLVVRPHAIGVSSEASANTVGAVVQASEFLGAATRYSVKAGNLELLVDARHLRGHRQLHCGDCLYLSIDPAQTVFLAS
jgi:iron(III) transport system ATP-binding protein